MAVSWLMPLPLSIAVCITLDKLSIVVETMCWTLGWVCLLVANNFSFANVAMFHYHGQRPDGDLQGGRYVTTPPHFSTSYVGLWASARAFMCTIVPVGFKLTCHGNQSLVYDVCLPLDLASHVFITACILFNLLMFCDTIFNFSIYSSLFAYL